MLFQRSVLIRAPLERVFDFHMDARNIARVAPPESRTELLEATDTPLRPGSRVVVRTVQMGAPITLEAEIVAVEEKRMFEDRQVRGPFQQWRHRHLFEPTTEGTRLTDEIEFELPGGLAGRLLASKLVMPQLERAVSYRHDALRRLLEEA